MRFPTNLRQVGRMLLRTYELHLRLPDGTKAFEPLTHPGTPAELMAAVRGVLHRHGADSVEIHEGGAHLFTVAASES